MGVSACGKSTVGRLLAQARGATYLDGDDFHPAENVARMAAGQALTDADRQGWLAALSDAAGPGPCRRRRRGAVVLGAEAPLPRPAAPGRARPGAGVPARQPRTAGRAHCCAHRPLHAGLAAGQPAGHAGAATARRGCPRLRRGADAAADRRRHRATGAFPPCPNSTRSCSTPTATAARASARSASRSTKARRRRGCRRCCLGRLPAAPQPGGLSQQLPLHRHAAMGVHPVRAHGDRPAGRQLAHLRAGPAFLFGRHAARRRQLRRQACTATGAARSATSRW